MSFSDLTLSTLAIAGVATGGIIAASNFSPFSKSKKDTNTKKIYEIENGGEIEDKVVIDFLKEVHETSNNLDNKFRKAQEKELITLNANISEEYQRISIAIEKLRNPNKIKNTNELKNIKKQVQEFVNLVNKLEKSKTKT